MLYWIEILPGKHIWRIEIEICEDNKIVRWLNQIITILELYSGNKQPERNNSRPGKNNGRNSYS